MAGMVVAVAGASGLVGSTIVELLEARRFPVECLRLLGSKSIPERTIPFRGSPHPVEELASDSFRGTDLAFFATSAEVSRALVPRALEAGTRVIDNSHAFRMDPAVPLVVPEVNAWAAARTDMLIANPNCCAIQLTVALAPLARSTGLRRVVVATYQSVSGAGREGIVSLETELFGEKDPGERDAPEARPARPGVFAHPIADNLIPEIGPFSDEGETGEESKICEETGKILDLDELRITVTAVRVPVRAAHSLAVWAELAEPLEVDDARQIWTRSPGVVVVDEPARSQYPTPRAAAGRDEVFVGRIRRDRSVASGLSFWVVADNVRKGAALNAIQIAESLIGDG
jgi:aspartate-semialdehyde dehydrogenase